MISIVILTLDEEINIARAIQSVEWSDDIHILDSFSSDKTLEIASSFGTNIHQRKFDNYANQRNHALQNIKYKYQWVLFLDADEEVTTALKNEILKVTTSSLPDDCIYRMRRKDFYLGQWIKHSSAYPTWFGRLVRPDRVEVKRAINEEYHTTGNSHELKEHLNHYPFAKGVSEWIAKHNRYSTMEAENFSQYKSDIKISEFLSKDPTTFRRSLKALAYNLPLRPVITFLYLYFIRGGFLDGKAGYYYAALRSSYELMIDAKRAEKKNNKSS